MDDTVCDGMMDIRGWRLLKLAHAQRECYTRCACICCAGAELPDSWVSPGVVPLFLKWLSACLLLSLVGRSLQFRNHFGVIRRKAVGMADRNAAPSPKIPRLAPAAENEDWMTGKTIVCFHSLLY